MHSFFSRRAILELEDSIKKKVRGAVPCKYGLICHWQQVDQLVCKLANRGCVPSNMFLAYRAATLDIITEYLFGHCQNNVNYPDFKAPLLIDIQTSVPMLWLLKSFPFIVSVLPLVPHWLAPNIHDQFRAFCSVQTFLVSCLDRSNKEAKAYDGLDHWTICHRLFDPSFCTPQLTFTNLAWLDEALSLIQAGSDTVGNTCTVGTFFVLNEKRILSRLTEELCSVWPEGDDCIDVAVLQTLPYLVSFVYVWVHCTYHTPDCCHQRSTSAFSWLCYTSSAGCRSLGCEDRGVRDTA